MIEGIKSMIEEIKFGRPRNELDSESALIENFWRNLWAVQKLTEMFVIVGGMG
jgi:hypothetical protein